MKIFKLVLYLLFTACIYLNSFAQVPGIPSNIDRSSTVKTTVQKNLDAETSKKAEQIKVVLEQVLAELEKLENPEKYPWFFSEAGKYVCETDKARAQKIFERSLTELNKAQKEGEFANKNDANDTVFISPFRFSIIQAISECDSEMAYGYLLKSRPRKLSESLTDFYKDPFALNGVENQRASGWVSMELSYEDRLRSEILRKNDARDVEFIKNDLKKAISSETLEFLRSLHRKNPVLANQLAESAARKLLEVPFYDEQNKRFTGTTQFTYNYNIAERFLREFGKEYPSAKNPFRISEESLRDIADKLSEVILARKIQWIQDDSLSTIRRFFPDRFAAIEQMKAEMSRRPEAIEKQKLKELSENGYSFDQILFVAESFSPENQQKLYKLAACKMVGVNEFAKAKDLIDAKTDDKDNFYKQLSLINYSHGIKAIDEKDFERSERFMFQIPDAMLRIDALSFLAESVFSSNPKENRRRALLILEKAKTEFDSNPEILTKRESLKDIISVYALIEPDAAFLMFDNLINQPIIDNISAENRKNAEDRLMGYSPTFSGVNSSLDFGVILSRLQDNDGEKVLGIINKHQSASNRISLKLSLLRKSNIDHFSASEILDYCRN